MAVDGLVEKPFEIGIDDLVRKMPLEERLYRHRCVEAWAMAVPWTGFPMRALLDLARPLGSAKFVRMATFHDKAVAPGPAAGLVSVALHGGADRCRRPTNELAFMVTGVYGKPLQNQFGAPLRLAVPWKYGFKSAKSLVRFTFTEERPKSFWEALQPTEYGFWANVNPQVPHPRWSQATERMLGTDERRPTLLFNGYGEQVAGMYRGWSRNEERLFVFLRQATLRRPQVSRILAQRLIGSRQFLVAAQVRLFQVPKQVDNVPPIYEQSAHCDL